MAKVKFIVSSRKEFCERAIKAAAGKKQGAIISFATPELLFGALGGRRWELLKALAGAGPMSIRATARLLKRDIKAVHTDVKRLLKSRILEKTEDDLIHFPYDSIHVYFELNAA